MRTAASVGGRHTANDLISLAVPVNSRCVGTSRERYALWTAPAPSSSAIRAGS